MLLFILFLLNICNAETLKIAVIDTGFSNDAITRLHACKQGSKDFTGGEYLIDEMGHGSIVERRIVDTINIPNYCLINLKIMNPNQAGSSLVEAIRYAVSLKVDAINISLEGKTQNINEREALSEASSNHIKVFIAAGNEGKDIGIYPVYPAYYSSFYSNLVTVGALDDTGHKLNSSNFGYMVTAWESGIDPVTGKMGTSFAAPVALGRYINTLKSLK